MAVKRRSTTEQAPNQPAEDREAVLDHAQQSTATATGQEIARLQGQEPDVDKDWNPEIEGDPQPDFPAGPNNAPQGAQGQPANFATNGTVAVNMVPSNTGPVPLAVAGRAGFPAAPEDRENLLAGHSYATDEELDEELVNRMSGPELRAAAHDRGFDIGARGTRASRRQFLRAQQEAGEKRSKKD